MRRRLFKGISDKIDLSDELYVKNEKERLVSFSLNPFRECRPGLVGKDSKEEHGERPPEWIELAGDLAWTVTFSSLTSNTTVTDPIAVSNYAVFFCLTWHLWATQTTYDIRYYTNDWWHRTFFASQLGIYAILASFSGSFNVAWQIDNTALGVFKGNVSGLTSQTIDQNQLDRITMSFRGINLTLFISRMLLFIQYMRVLWYRKRSGQFWSWRFILMPLSTLFAGSIFLGCFIAIRINANSKAVAISQLILWGVAVLLQAVGAAFTPNDGVRVLKSESTMAPRLASLTVIILGEGLNGICSTLRSNMNPIGINSLMVGLSITTLLILYFIWLLYFDGFKIKYSPSRILEEFWLVLHFPLHLCLILLLEGVKNIFIYANALESVIRLELAFEEALAEYSATGRVPEHPKLETLLRVLNLSWQEEMNRLLNGVNTDMGLNDPKVAGTFARWWGSVIHSVMHLYTDEPDPQAEANYETFAASSDATLAADYLSKDSPLFLGIFQPYVFQMQYTGHWIVAVAGSLMLCMAIINTVQHRPRNQFAWGYCLNRGFVGFILIIFGGITSRWIEKDYWSVWILPVIAIGFGVAVIVDWLILFFSVRSINNMESLSRTNITYSGVGKGDYDSGTGIDLDDLSYLPYGHDKHRRSESASVSLYSQGPMGSSASLYSAEGETVKWHEGSQYHLPYKP